jgi:putative membrane protein
MSRDAKHPSEAILRDQLALDRTKLANERTFLAYLRTTIVLVLSGITIVRLFSDEVAMIVLACVLLIAGVITGIVGTARSLKIARRMRDWERQLEGLPPESPGKGPSHAG